MCHAILYHKLHDPMACVWRCVMTSIFDWVKAMKPLAKHIEPEILRTALYDMDGWAHWLLCHVCNNLVELDH